LSFLDEIRKQPDHVREIMFALCVVITISLVGLVWFRSFEEDIFVMLNPEPDKQEQFYAEREKRTPTVYANVTAALGNLRASMYGALGFFNDYNSGKDKTGEDLKGDTHKLPISGDK
jgi:hypothetical protein